MRVIVIVVSESDASSTVATTADLPIVAYENRCKFTAAYDGSCTIVVFVSEHNNSKAKFAIPGSFYQRIVDGAIAQTVAKHCYTAVVDFDTRERCRVVSRHVLL